MTDAHRALARQLTDLFSQLPQVEAVAVAGSLTSGAVTDKSTDIDLYVYTTALVPLENRLAMIETVGGASRADMNLDYWDLGDEWFHAPTGIEVDVIFWDTQWIESMLDRVLRQHQASAGYTTCYWYTIFNSHILFDRKGWMSQLKAMSEQSYPEDLRRAIIRRNYALLRGIIPAYLHQVEKAARRGDLVSVNHRVAALLASYFDVVFAANGVLHPGEKRLLEQAGRLCASLPQQMAAQVTAVLQTAGLPGTAVAENITLLLDALDHWLGKKEDWLQKEWEQDDA